MPSPPDDGPHGGVDATGGIAVIGVSCRLPGASGPDELWQLLVEGRHALDGPSPRRAGLLPGRAPEHGGFLPDVAGFDADFFSMSPAEAAVTDPQQRLVLELVREALEDARTVPDALRGTRTGVWVGAMADDYALLTGRAGGAAATPHTLTGLQRALMANRVSYLFGVRGPSLTVDCGQSSSLVAVHLACQSLLHGESDLAVAAGVQLNLAPESTGRVDAFGALSPDGRCRTFDARAGGYVRGEGGGVVVLKPLERALADGDPVRAVILGSATNNDGGGPRLTTPDAGAQQEVIRSAWEAAGVDASRAGYVELHGTGTPTGDAVEASALGAVLGGVRPAGNPLPVGSVKTNVGHLEGGAGIAGLLKTVLSVQHGVIPPSLHFREPSPAIPLDALRLRVQQDVAPWSGGRRLAGVSSFGVGGSNCHVVLADAGAPAGRRTRPPGGRAIGPWLVHGRGEAALATQAARLAAHVRAHPGLEPTDVGFSLATTRSVFEHRAAVSAPDREGMLAGLDALAAGELAADVVTGHVPRPREVAFVFPGQGTQWPLMARRLLQEQPAFAAAVADCALELDALTGWSLLDVLNGASGAPSPDRVDVVQPLLFAVMVALAALWQHHGVEPAAVVGHSQGEVAAACVAGALSLADAARVVAVRSRLIRRELSGHGGMASVLLDHDAVADRLRPWAGRLTRAAVNSPEATVIAGDTAVLDEACTALEHSGVKVRRVAVDYASHSPAVEALRDPLYAALEGIRPIRARIPFYSSLAGRLIDTTELDAGYWYRNLRHEVRFADAVGAQLADGLETFVEVSPHPVLLPAVRRTASAADVPVTLVETLTRGEGGTDRFHAALAAAHVGGARVRWPSVWRGTGARPVPLPVYAFQRRPHWLGDTATVQGPATDAVPHPARAAGALVRRLSDVLPAERRRAATEFVATVAGTLLGLPGPAAVDVDRPLRELGLNSLLTLRMTEHLSTASGLPVGPKTVFDHPTCAALAAHLTERVNLRPPARGGEDVPAAGDEGGTEAGTGEGGGGADPDGPAPTIVHRDEAAHSGGAETPRLMAARHDGADEPIAVVGLACRFPGADGPEAFWHLLQAGEDAVRPVPARRWPPAAGDHDTPSAVERAALLDQDIEGFDAHFFGISPSEAAEMDPQQRLMLEVAWEAIEDAGHGDDTLRDTRTGVFIGVTWHDFADRTRTAAVSPYTATGKALNMVANRLSYTLGLRGPSLAVDTACSSSLLAVHLACQSLRTGESAMAIAGGVNLLLAQDTFRALEEFGGLSPDGRCKTFDASADGYARGEGCGAVVLKPLSAALADGDDIWCTIKGSAANNDGRSNGLTAPNPAAQEEVLRDACLRAGVAPSGVQYVETHGTGTALGDHIETAALGAVLGEGRPDDTPLLLGAVKTNIGHLEAAAGVAGLIKTALVLRHRTVPVNLHCRTPNPDIDFTALRLRLPRDGEALPAHGPVLAGVSSFGWGGTNVHVVLESHGGTAPERRRPHPVGRGAVLFFSPPGGDWAGTGRRLYRTRPVFRTAVDRCDREFARHTGRSLTRSLHRDAVPCPEAAFAVHLAMAALLEEDGIRPAAVVGAGTGEIVACVVAGVLELADGVRLFHGLVRTGRDEAQAVAEAAEHDVARMLPAEGPVRVAAGLGTRTTLLTGPVAALRTLVGGWAADGIRCALLTDADGAPLVLPRWHEAPPVAGARCGTARFPVLSALTGTEPAGTELEDGHFVRAVRAPARLADAVSRLLDDGHRVILDMGCHPAAVAAVRQTADDRGEGALVLPSAVWCGPGRAALLGPLLEARPAPGPRPDCLVTLTAKSSAALRELAGRVATAIEEEPAPVDLRDVAAAAARRSGGPHRLALAVASPDVLVDVLRDYAVHGTARGLAVSARPAHRRPKIAFVFPGPPRSAEDLGAVRELLAEEPVFRTHAESCDRGFTALTGRSVLTELTGVAPDGTGDRALSAPALFTVQSAMTALLRSWGVEPEVFHGQGAGRFAALLASGEIPAAEAMRRAAGHPPAAYDGEASRPPARGPVAGPGTAGSSWDGMPADPDGAVPAPDGWPGEDIDAVVELRVPPLLRLRPGTDRDPADGVPADGPAPVSPARHRLLSVLARLFVLGTPVCPPGRAAARWKLPHYPWQRKRFPLPGSPPPVTPGHHAPDGPCPLGAGVVPAAGIPGPRVVAGTGRPGTQAPPATSRERATREEIVRTLRQTVAETTGVPQREIGDDQPLRDLGMTSVMGVELCNRWEAAFGLRLPDTTVWNHPTVEVLAALIERRLRGAPGVDRPATVPGAPSRSGSGGPQGVPVPASLASDAAPAGAAGRDEASGIARLEAELERELTALARQMAKENPT